MKKILSLCALVVGALAMSAATYSVSDAETFNQTAKRLQAGDSLVMTAGIWTDAALVVKRAEGTADRPITITVEQMGKTLLQGASSLRFSGDYVHVSGLVFVNGGQGVRHVIEMRTSKEDYANHSVVSHCVIDHYNPQDKAEQTDWMSMWGKDNIVEYCYFGGKSNQGTTFIVWPNDSASWENHHIIRYNYFGTRKPLGANGGETIRIGTSHVSKHNSWTTVEHNLFEHCNGEVEIVSVKSCENVIRNNTFLECEGSLVLRHGDRNEVYGNVFIGNGKKHTGGVRIVNEGQYVHHNLFYKCAGKEFRAALCIMNGIPNTVLNGYHQVKDARIEKNTFVSCAVPFELCMGKGSRDRDAKPERTVIRDNMVYCPTAADLVVAHDTDYDISFLHNVLFGMNGFDPTSAAQDVKTSFWHDMMVPDVEGFGAMEILAKDDYVLADKSNCGPAWYTPISENASAPRKPKNWEVATSDDLMKALRKAQGGDVITIADGEYLLTKKAKISDHLIIRAADNAKPLLRIGGESNTIIGFEIGGHARLEMCGLTLRGDDAKGNPVAKYCFTANKETANNYMLVLDHCDISGFNITDGGAVFKSYKNTFADSIIVRNSTLHHSFRGFALAEEKEEKGLYNAEYVSFYNTLFLSITQWAIDYNRLGIDESTSGGTLYVDHCVFDEVNDREDQTILRQKGINHVILTNTIFLNSSAKWAIRLSGHNQHAERCLTYLTGRIGAQAGATATDMYNGKPKFQKKTYSLQSSTTMLGTDGKPIGILP